MSDVLPIYIGLVPYNIDNFPMNHLSALAGALQKQVNRDVRNYWMVNVIINYFSNINELPEGYWPIFIVRNDYSVNGNGNHSYDSNNKPFALVKYNDLWTLTASHEMIEIVLDPWGNRTVASDSISGKDRVEYIFEPCDPCQHIENSYSIDGITVCDFYTMAYFSPTGAPGERYSFTGSIKRPKQILKGGYLSWLEPNTNRIFQKRVYYPSGREEIIEIPNRGGVTGSLRGLIDNYVKEDDLLDITSKKNKEHCIKEVKKVRKKQNTIWKNKQYKGVVTTQYWNKILQS